MTVKTTLSFTDRHHGFLARKVREGVFASQSAAVAAAVEQLIQDEAEREVALLALAQEIRRRAATPAEGFLDATDVLAAARARLANPA